MPEGPEIRLAADKVAKALVGRTTTDLFFHYDHLVPYIDQLVGQKVVAIDTFGKGMLTRFENELNIYSHNQLYGVWMVRKPGDFPETKRSLRLAIHNEKASALLYSASEIEVLRDEDVETHHFMSKVGPDLLNPAVTVERVIEQFNSDRFKRKRLYTLLLDQKFLAGVGNYLRTEILFVAGVHPDKRPIDCSPEKIEALARAAVDLTRQSYETRGITNDLKLVEKLKAEGFTRSKYRYWAFGREGRPCYVCGNPIEKHVYGGRRLYLCPTTQPR